MNHVYRLVWNRAKRLLQVASEFSGGRGGASGGGRRRPAMRPLSLACALSLGSTLASAWAPAIAGSVVSAGDITLSGDITEPGNASYNSTGGSIFQPDPTNDSIDIAGSAIFAALGIIDLSGMDNDFHDSVYLQGDAAAINDANDLVLLAPTITHDLTATSHGALSLGDAIIGGSLTAHSNGGTITGGPLSVGGVSSFDAGNGDIQLVDAGNDFVGAVNLNGGDAVISDANALTLGVLAVGGDLTVTNTGALNLGAGGVGGSLSATSNGGAITQTGALSVTGTSVISAGNGDIHLTNADNDFGGAVNLAGSNVLVTDRNDLAISTLVNGSGGDVALIAGGILTLSSGITTTGDLTLASNGGSLASAGSLSGNDVSLTGRDGVILMHDITASGALALHSKGPITQSGGSLLVSGSSAIDTGAGSITLTGLNDFGGVVNITSGNVQINDTNALALGTLATDSLTAHSAGALNLGSGSISGDLGASSHDGAITQSGSLTVAGSSNIDAGTGAITLTDAGNDFGGTVSLAGGVTQIVDANALTLGTLATAALSTTSGGPLDLGQGNVDGDLAADSNGGAITQSGGLTVAGSSAVDAGTGAITLANAGNDFGGAVSLTGGDATIVDQNALTFGALATGNLIADSTGALNLGSGSISGNLGASSHGGAITQSGALTVAGSSAIDAGAGSISLANAGNDFGGAVSLTGGDATIVDQNALTFGALATGNLIADSTGALNLGAGDVGGSLSANSSGGAITQTGALSVTGTSVISAGNGDIHLTNADNDFGGAVNLAGSNVLVTDRNDLAISTLVNGSGGDVALIAGGILTLSSGITTTGDLTLASNGGSLASAGSLSGNDVSLTGRDGVILMHDITASGALALHSKGPITQSGGSLLVSGDSTIDAGTGAITLANAGNDFGGAISLTGGDATIVDQNALTFGALATGNLIADGSGALNLGSGSISGNLGARSHGGAITQSGALTVAGSSVIDAGAGSISLANAGNDFGGAVSLTGGNATIIDQNALDVGSTVIAGTLDVRSGGDLAQSGALSANGLTGASTGTTTLADTNNAVANLGDFSAAGFSLVNTTPLSIVGTLDSSGDIHLDSGDVTVTGALDAAGTITLGATTTLLFTGNGALAGDLVDDTSVAFDQNIDNLYAGSLSGSGVLDKLGGGTLVLDGDSSAFVGTTDVQAGTLIVSGNAGDGAILGGDVSVAANATLGGYGEIGGNASLSSGARLAPGNGIGTLAIDGNATFAQGSVLDFEFGTPAADFSILGSGDSVAVGGDLTLDGATLDVTDAGSMGPGLYALFSYGGALTYDDGGIVLGGTPAGHALSIQILTGDKRINLLDTSGITLNFWNGNGLASTTQMGGGDGTWSTTSTNWTNADGSVKAAMQPQPGFAIFGGAAGKVGIDDANGAVAATGLQFTSDGYVLNGDALTLVSDDGAAPTIRVGDGSAAGSGMAATIDGVVAGSDGLAKSDLGTLFLTADNTFIGTIRIDGGTLSVARNANLGDAGNALALDGGVLRITGTTFQSTTRDVGVGSHGGGLDVADAGNVFTLSQAISGDGAFSKLGAGTLVLTGANAYGGGTAIVAGTLRIGDGGTIGSIVGDVTDNGTLAFDRGDALTFAGVVSGTGALRQVGGGSTTLTGANTYTGGTFIDSGTLQIGDGGTTGSIAGDVTDNGTLVFARSDALVFAHAISGIGSLRQAGSGMLVLDGDSSAFAGTTSILSGGLIVGSKAGGGAVLGGDVSVSAGALLGGQGEIGGNVTNAGTLSPGTSIGTLTIHGDYIQTAQGNFEVDVAPDGQSDLLAVDGNASLAGGTVAVAIDGDWKPRTEYTILTAAGGVDGAFDSASSNLAFLDVVLDYTGESVLLSLQRNDLAFTSFAGTRNQRAAAAAADTLGWHNAAYNALTLLGAQDAPRAFDALSGEIHASTRTGLMEDSHYLRDAIGNRLLTASGNGGWISGWRHWTHADGDGNAAALRGDGNGYAGGADFAFGEHGRLGAVIGAERSGTDAGARASSTDIDSRHFGVYTSVDTRGTLLQAGAARSSHDIDARRAIGFGGFSDSLRAKYSASTTQAFVDASHAFAIGRGGVSPFLDLAWVRIHSDGFDERGGDAALQVDAANSKHAFAMLGVRWNAVSGSGDTLRLRGSAGWSHSFGGGDVPIDSQRFLTGSDTFEIAGTPLAEDAFALDAGLHWQATRRLAVDADYIGRFANDLSDQGARVTLQVAF